MSVSGISAAYRIKLKLGSNWIYGNIRYSPKAPLIYDFSVYGFSVLLFDESAFTLCASVLICRYDTGLYRVPFPPFNFPSLPGALFFNKHMGILPKVIHVSYVVTFVYWILIQRHTLQEHFCVHFLVPTEDFPTHVKRQKLFSEILY